MKGDQRENEQETNEEKNPFKMNRFSRDKWRFMERFDVNMWYNSLKKFTFGTIFLDLSMDQAKSMVNHYQQFLNSKSGRFTDKDQQNLDQLTQSIESSIQSLGSNAFIRLSSRSPKDAAECSLESVQNELRRLREEEKEERDDHDTSLAEKRLCNDLMRAIYKASIDGLRVRSGKEAVELLLKSERIFVDLIKSIPEENGNSEPEHWNMQVILREFSDGLNPELEFRCFAVKGRITAISQYNDMLYYPFMSKQETRRLIVSSICDYWKGASDCVDYEYCVVDFVLRSLNDPQVKIIEINPFGPMTGASLFNWDYDRRIIQGGEDLFGDLEECRIESLSKDILEERTKEYPETVLRIRKEIMDRMNPDLISALHPDMQSLLSSPIRRKRNV